MKATRLRLLAAAFGLGLALAGPLSAQDDDAPPSISDSGGISFQAAEAMLDAPAAFTQRRLQQLAVSLEQAAELDTQAVEPRVLAARAHLLASGTFGQYRAAQLADEALRIDPKSVGALAVKARAAAASDCLPCAQHVLGAAGREQRMHPLLRAAQGDIFAARAAKLAEDPSSAKLEDRARDYDRLAVQEYEAALRRETSARRKANLLAALFDLHDAQGRSAKAEAAIRRALELAPADAGLLERQAGFLLMVRGRFEEAAKVAERAAATAATEQVRRIQGLALYGAWAAAQQRASGESPAAGAWRLEAARAAYPDVDEIFLAAAGAEETAQIAQALLDARVYSSARGDYRNKDGDTPLGAAVTALVALAAADEEYAQDAQGAARPALAQRAPRLFRLVDALLAEGANPNAHASESGEPLLAVAARSADVALFERLLAAGANPHAAGRNGATALMAAADVADEVAALRMAGMLLERAADVLPADAQRRTALMIAAWRGHTGLAVLLLKRGARVDAADEEGNTALDYAAVGGQRKMAELLVSAGAEVVQHETLCGSGDTADLAEDGGYPELAEWLRKRIKQAL
jgi:hypothetical protein